MLATDIKFYKLIMFINLFLYLIIILMWHWGILKLKKIYMCHLPLVA